MRFKNTLVRLALPGLLISASIVLAQDATPDPMMEATDVMLEPGPDVITLEAPGLMPEGIEYDAATDRFLVGSISTGTINAFDLEGTLTPFTESDNLSNSATIGIQVDEANNRLLVDANARDNSAAALGVYDLTTGEELMWVDLTQVLPDAESYFVNDLAVDTEGNAYISDSANGVFYKVDMEGNASVFLSDPSFVGNFILNGVTYHPDSYLIAVRGPGLIKIPLDDPASFRAVELDQDVNGDGLIFTDDGALVAVANMQGKVLRVESDDEWATATVTGEFEAQPINPTTAALRGDEVYVVHANFNDPAAESYPVLKVMFTDIGM